jgi:hypothetical protein
MEVARVNALTGDQVENAFDTFGLLIARERG